MPGFSPRVPVDVQLRRLIYENYNNTDAVFNNDDLFAMLQKGGDVDPEWTIDDLEPAINLLCSTGITRNIGQNFTTIWLKIFDPLRARPCGSCGNTAFVIPAETACPGCHADLS